MTGATQPIGQAIIAELAAHGAACIYGPFISKARLPYSTLTPKNTACDHSPLSSSIDSLASALSKSAPNTKIIPYPLAPSNEQDTLTLVDDVLNSWGRLDVWVCSSGLLGPPSIDMTTPADLQKCFEANSLAPFFALKYAPPAMEKLLETKGNYPNAAMKDQQYGSIIVVSSVASTYGGEWLNRRRCAVFMHNLKGSFADRND